MYTTTAHDDTDGGRTIYGGSSSSSSAKPPAPLCVGDVVPNTVVVVDASMVEVDPSVPNTAVVPNLDLATLDIDTAFQLVEYLPAPLQDKLHLTQNSSRPEFQNRPTNG